MSLGSDEVRKIAELARLAIGEDEIPVYAQGLSSILDFVEQMNEADVTGIEPMAHPMDAVQRLRPDEVTEGNERDRFQANAPVVEKGLYLVPRVIE